MLELEAAQFRPSERQLARQQYDPLWRVNLGQSTSETSESERQGRDHGRGMNFADGRVCYTDTD